MQGFVELLNSVSIVGACLYYFDLFFRVTIQDCP